MDEEIISRWNSRVSSDDKVIFLGDFCFPRREKTVEYYLGRLNGDIIFIKGSHDGCLNTIITSMIIKYGGIDWWCQHEPVLKYSYNLCGHVHERWRTWKNHDKIAINVGTDQWNFYPITIDEILKVVNDAPEGYNKY